jgi:hypothetical protein
MAPRRTHYAGQRFVRRAIAALARSNPRDLLPRIEAFGFLFDHGPFLPVVDWNNTNLATSTKVDTKTSPAASSERPRL